MSQRPYYIHPVFSNRAPENVVYRFYGRQGGVSTGIYDSLNCAAGSDDAPENVRENCRLVVEDMGGTHLQKTYQIHSAICTFIDAPQDKIPQGDALVTDKPNIVLGILTADCAPVLFTGVKDNGEALIGAAHAGWKGALGGVLQATVKVMLEHGAILETIQAIVGPTITKASYEVSKGFESPFLEEGKEAIQFFSEGRAEDKLFFDLPGFNAFQLQKTGVKNIILSDIDTLSDEKNYFSNRRRVHRGEPDYGRQIATIMIRGE